MRELRIVLLAGLLLYLAAEAQGAQPVCETRRFEGSRFTICPFDPRHQELRLAWKGPDGTALRSFARLEKALGRDRDRVRFAMNAGMYEEDGTPLGLYVEYGWPRQPINGRAGTGNFYMKPNGIFSLDATGTVRVETSEAFVARHVMPAFATQSGPVLVTGNLLHPSVSPDGPSQNIRNAVGIRDTNAALFVISEDPVSFGRLARFLRDGQKCRDVLYLDGVVSSAWIPKLHRQDHAAPLGPMIVVMDRR
jgi:uncharacterized protein YigE (DUF2233 family)